jgi:hypothetical protein
MRYSFGFDAGGGGLQSVATDNITVFGDGTKGNPLYTYNQIIVTVYSDEILNLGSRPVQLLPTLARQEYYVIDRIQMEYSFRSIPYVFPTSPTFYLDGCFDSYIDKTLLTSSTDTACVVNGNLRNTYQVGSGSGSTLVKTNKDVLGSDLIMGTTNGDNPINGDGQMRVKIYYMIVRFGVTP